jgi:hypothetical protein
MSSKKPSMFSRRIARALAFAVAGLLLGSVSCYLNPNGTGPYIYLRMFVSACLGVIAGGLIVVGLAIVFRWRL